MDFSTLTICPITCNPFLTEIANCATVFQFDSTAPSSLKPFTDCACQTTHTTYPACLLCSINLLPNATAFTPNVNETQQVSLIADWQKSCLSGDSGQIISVVSGYRFNQSIVAADKSGNKPITLAHLLVGLTITSTLMLL